MRINVSIRSFLFTLMMLAMPGVSSAGIVFSIGIAPPPLPVYEQPVCPGDSYLWTPGYWAYDDEGGYFWVPGTWVMAPEPGFLWTPGYWGWGDGLFMFHQGYWGSHVGFYGGINYGFGYVGVGYEGGYWNNGAFMYNRSVNNVTNITNVYNKTVIVNNNVRNVSYNGGEGGISVRPNNEERAAASERHIQPTPMQTQHVQAASSNRELFESANHGKPAIAATAKPGEFSRGVVAAREAGPSYRPPTARSAAPGTAGGGAPRPATSNAVHPKELPPMERTAPNTGNARQDQKYQQQQDRLRAQQDQDRQKLQQKQDQEHQQLERTKASDAQKQQVEQKHQQQTQQLAQKHAQQQQKFQQSVPKEKR